MMLSEIIVAYLALGAAAAPSPQAPAVANQPIPATGENGKPNGIFGFGDAKPAGGSAPSKGGSGMNLSTP
jgi:hypothetical protein